MPPTIFRVPAHAEALAVPRLAAGRQQVSDLSQPSDCCKCDRALIIFVSHPLANVAVSDCAIGVRGDAEPAERRARY
jgi:hypothetical protein